MCLILFAYKVHPRYPLIIAANRDEFYQRPTATAQFWRDKPDILGGRDLEAMGTWLGVTKAGRFAAITNYRDPSMVMENARTRGELVSNYLNGKDNPRDYLNYIKGKNNSYNGFNLILGDTNSCWYYSNITNVIEEVSHGVHGLSNHLLDTPWPKVVKGTEALIEAIQDQNLVKTDKLFAVLADSQRVQKELLPDTGISQEWEGILSSIFVKSLDYGTRASTIVMMDKLNRILFIERSFSPGETQWSEITYELEPNNG